MEFFFGKVCLIPNLIRTLSLNRHDLLRTSQQYLRMLDSVVDIMFSSTRQRASQELSLVFFRNSNRQDDMEKRIKFRVWRKGLVLLSYIFRVYCHPRCRKVIKVFAAGLIFIQHVRYVIDSGYVKLHQYNPSTRIYSFDVIQINIVRANQHAGHVGRTCPAKCYWLYPSLVYNEEFLDATVLEKQRSSLPGCVLHLKSLDLPDIDILKFDFLDPPSSESLVAALKRLYLIDAINENGSIMSVGRRLAELPLEPLLSRTLLEVNKYGCYPKH
ncbi:Helicase-associated domain [Dillenia turbinata]|uniref:RNA helicase n=1 Tax=Dillenia turbinata TaxID=194707 RepID=A0AAN8ZET7_9MAGN